MIKHHKYNTNKTEKETGNKQLLNFLQQRTYKQFKEDNKQ